MEEFYLDEKEKKKDNSMKTIILEGNINSGKSCLMRNIEKKWKDRIYIFCEGFAESNELEKRYEDGVKNGFEFQNSVIDWYLKVGKRLKEMKEKEIKINGEFDTNEKIVVIERSLFSAYHVFCKLLKDEKGLNDKQMDELKKKQEGVDEFFEKNAKVVYLDCDYMTCYERVKRQNKFSSFISLDYLKKIEDVYEEVLPKDSFHINSCRLNENEVLSEFEEIVGLRNEKKNELLN